jgi:hypothetical protein
MPIRPRSPRNRRHGRERRRQQRAVLDDADRAALLGDEDAAVGACANAVAFESP